MGLFTKIAAVLLAAALLLCSCGSPSDGEDAASPAPGGDTAKTGTPILSDEQTRQIVSLVMSCARTVPDAFARGEDVPVYSMARFLYTRMQADGVADGFEHSADGQFILVPIEQVRAYADIYFAMDELTLDFASLEYFDGQFVTIPNPEADEEESPYEFTLDRVTPGAGKITVTLNLSSGGVLYQRWVYTLKADGDGNARFASMAKRPVEFGLYAVNNASAVLDRLLSVPVNSLTAGKFQFYPFGDEMLVSITNGQYFYLGYLDLNTFSTDKYIREEPSAQEQKYDLQTVGEEIFVYRKDSVQVYSKDLIKTQTVLYPSALKDLSDRYTKRFCLSPDHRYIAFTNEEGLQFYNLQSGDVHLMQPNPASSTGIISATWDPIVFNEKSGSLLARQTKTSGEIDRFGIFSTKNPSSALERTIRLRCDADSLVTVRGDWLMVFAPTSVRIDGITQSAPLEQSCVEYNVVTGTPRLIPTEVRALDAGGAALQDGRMMFSPDYIYLTDTIRIGDMVSSYSVQSFRKANEGPQSAQRRGNDFGYIDRRATFRLLGASNSNKVIAACDGMFIQAIVVF